MPATAGRTFVGSVGLQHKTAKAVSAFRRFGDKRGKNDEAKNVTQVSALLASPLMCDCGHKRRNSQRDFAV